MALQEPNMQHKKFSIWYGILAGKIIGPYFRKNEAGRNDDFELVAAQNPRNKPSRYVVSARRRYMSHSMRNYRPNNESSIRG